MVSSVSEEGELIDCHPMKKPATKVAGFFIEQSSIRRRAMKEPVDVSVLHLFCSNDAAVIHSAIIHFHNILQTGRQKDLPVLFE